MSEQIKEIQVVKHEDIVLTGDTQELAKNITDEEFKALVIQNYRAQMEILRFVRTADQALAGLAQSPMGSVLLPPSAGMPNRMNGKRR